MQANPVLPPVRRHTHGNARIRRRCDRGPRGGLLVAGWEHPFSLNPHGRAIEAAVQAEPVSTEQVQHDERYVQLRVQRENGGCVRPAVYAGQPCGV